MHSFMVFNLPFLIKISPVNRAVWRNLCRPRDMAGWLISLLPGPLIYTDIYDPSELQEAVACKGSVPQPAALSPSSMSRSDMKAG